MSPKLAITLLVAGTGKDAPFILIIVFIVPGLHHGITRSVTVISAVTLMPSSQCLRKSFKVCSFAMIMIGTVLECKLLVNNVVTQKPTTCANSILIYHL